MRQKVKQPLRYFGGKSFLADDICKLMQPHQTYTEVFGGSAAVLLTKKRSKIEVYNDLNGHVYNFFKVLREKPNELINTVALTPYCREEYLHCRDYFHSRERRDETDDPVEKARRFYVVSWQSRAGAGAGWPGGWRSAVGRDIVYSGAVPSERWTDLEPLYQAAERFRGVQIESLDAIECIKRYDSERTLHYVDPPYLLSTRGTCSSYEVDIPDDYHNDLADTLNSVKGMVMLSGYNSPEYNELFKGWHKIEWSVIRNGVKADGSRDAVECLWLNDKACVQTRMEL